MIEVTKSIYRYPDGSRRIEKLTFYVLDHGALEAKRKRDCKNLGCESIRYFYHETK